MERLFEERKNKKIYPQYIQDSEFYNNQLNKIYKTENMLKYNAFKTYTEIADMILLVNYFNFDNMSIKNKYLGKTNKKAQFPKENNSITTYTLDSVLDEICISNDPADKQLLRGGLSVMCQFLDYKKQENPSKYETIVQTETDYYGIKVEGKTSINKLDYAKEILMKKYLPYIGESKIKEKILTRESEGMTK